MADITKKRTINGCERFHREFGEYFYNAHPTIYKFLDAAKLLQTKTGMKTGGNLGATVSATNYCKP